MKRSDFLKSLGGFAIAFSGVGKLAIIESPVVAAPIVTAKYIAGYVKMSKQMMANLPFLQSVLPEMLLKDYYNKENDNLHSL